MLHEKVENNSPAEVMPASGELYGTRYTASGLNFLPKVSMHDYRQYNEQYQKCNDY